VTNVERARIAQNAQINAFSQALNPAPANSVALTCRFQAERFVGLRRLQILRMP
jgi:hypothetical protein